MSRRRLSRALQAFAASLGEDLPPAERKRLLDRERKRRERKKRHAARLRWKRFYERNRRKIRLLQSERHNARKNHPTRKRRREHERVLALWARRKTAQQIADELGLPSIRKVFHHLRAARDRGDPRAHHRPQWINRFHKAGETAEDYSPRADIDQLADGA